MCSMYLCVSKKRHTMSKKEKLCVAMWLCVSKKNHTLVISKRRNEFIKQSFDKAFVFRNDFC